MSVLNCLISTNRLSIGENSAKKMNTDGKIYDQIVSLRQIYHNLWENTGQFNNTFKWSLLLMIGTSFVTIVVNFYRTLVWLITPSEADIEVIILFFVWSAGHTFYFIRLSSACNNVSQQVIEITELISFFLFIYFFSCFNFIFPIILVEKN